MAVLHEYVSASEQEGYYIYDAYDGTNVTYQVSSLARELLDTLDSCTVDEQLPGEVFHILHRLGLIYTQQSGVEQPDGLDQVPTSRDAKSLPSRERGIFFSELLASNTLEHEQRQEIQEYVDERGIKTDAGADLHGNWIPSNPDDDTFQGEVMKTFQDGEWGFISSDNTDLDEDIFFHINELESMILRPGMSVEFTYSETTEGYQACHVKRLTDALGRDLEEEFEKQDGDSDIPRNGESVGITSLAEGDYVEAQIDRTKGKKGLGRKGYLHIYHRQASGDDYKHFSERDDPPPVNKWVVVQVTAIRSGYAEAEIKSAPEDAEPPLYLP